MAVNLWTGNEGYLSARNLDPVLRHALQPECKFRQFSTVKSAVGKNKGETFHWNVYSNVATQGTVLVETSTMPQTNYTVTQGTMTITEYGNSVPYTGKLRDLAEHSIKEIINKVMKNDAKKAFDVAAHGQFAATPLVVTPTDGTATDSVVLSTNGTAAGTNNVALGKDHVKAIIDMMKERNIPTYSGNDYAAIARPTTWRNLKNNLESVHQYVDSGFQMILAGEIGRYEGVRFFEQTNIAASGFANGKSGWAYFFGEDTVAEGVAVPEEIRAKIPDDYGRGNGIAWYYLGGFALQYPQAADSRIVRWGSTN
jgi:N4-gp56 family major capsid protein